MYVIQNKRNTHAFLAGFSPDAIWTGYDFALKYLTFYLAELDCLQAAELGYQVTITEA